MKRHVDGPKDLAPVSDLANALPNIPKTTQHRGLHKSGLQARLTLSEAQAPVKKIMVIHPEGNINNNPNLTGIIQILCEHGYGVDYYALKKDIPQYSPCQGASMILKDPQGRSELDGLVTLDRACFQAPAKSGKRFDNNIPRYDLIIGIDRGIIEAEILSCQQAVPYGLISYEIFFAAEAGEGFKKEEINACRKIAFAVCQDSLRAKYLAVENRIDPKCIITMPMGGRDPFPAKKNNYLYHKLRIPNHQKIALVIGSLSKWTMVDYILSSMSLWPDDWVLVLHGRYGYLSDELGIFKRCKHMRNVRFSLEPANSLSKLNQILQSADVGLAFYRPVNNNPYTGDNIRHIGMASGKIATYLQSSLPVIINEIGEMSDHVRNNGLGCIVDVSTGFSPQIEPDELSKMRKNCHDFYNQHLNLKHTIQPLLQRISSLTRKRSITIEPAGYNRSCAAPKKDPFTARLDIPKRIVLFPKISVITPSMNHSKYLERCMLSVLGQNYPNLEYIVMDGGSSDGSEGLIRKYDDKLAYWQSQPDIGQYWAIQEGIRRSTGDIITWLNSDDIFAPHAFFIVASIFLQRPEISWITGRRASTDAEGLKFFTNSQLSLWSRRKYLDKRYDKPFIQQEGSFWRRSLWERAGGKLDTGLKLAGDLELWSRFFRYASLYTVDYGLGFYRAHGENKALKFMDQYRREAESVIDREIKVFHCEKDPVIIEAPSPISKKQIGEYLSLSGMLIPEPVDPVELGSADVARKSVIKKLSEIKQTTNSTVDSADKCQKPNVTCRLKKIAEIDIKQFSCATGERVSNSADCMVTFLLPTKNRAQGLNKTLNSLSEAMQDVPYEILLYADQRGENITQCQKDFSIQKVFYDRDVFGEHESFSWSKLMNHAFSQASGQWIMYGSDDIVLYPHCIKNAISHMQSRKSENIGGITFLHRNITETYDGFFTDFGYDTLGGDKPFINFGLIKAEAFESTKGFDENLRFFWADVDICVQIQRQGYTIIPSLGSLVDHHNALESVQKEKRISLFECDTDYFYTKWCRNDLFSDHSPLAKIRYFLSGVECRKIIDKVSGKQKKRAVTKENRKTNVVIDGVIFQLQYGTIQGVSRVWRNLIFELARQIPNSNIIVLQRNGFSVPIDGVSLHTVPAFQLESPDSLDEDDDMLRQVCRELRADIFISTYYTRAPGVTNLAMIHDLIPEIFQFDLSQPEWVAKQRIIETADAFICVSRTTQLDLATHYPQITNRPTIVAYNGLEDCFKKPSVDEVSRIRQKLKLDKSYVMLVGNRHGYKNGIGMLTALAEIEDDDKPCVLFVGGEKPISPKYRTLNEKIDIRYAGQLNDQDLVAAYGGALALMFPSKYEGFGLPVIEAMACGCPVIALDSPAVVEIGGDAVCYADLCLPEEIDKAFKKVLDTSQRQAFIEKGYACAAKFDWQSSSRQLSTLIDAMQGKPSILLTAVVSTYNASEFIRGCLEDLENQTLSDRLEILVVDSASKQDEAAVVRDFQRHYTNIKYIRTTYRENVYGAWNRGIKFALAKYVTNANTDDRHRRDAFEKMVGVLEEADEIALVYADVIKTETANETYNRCNPTGVLRWPDWNRRALLSKGCFIGPQPVWRKKVHDTYGYFNSHYDVAGDFEFWLRISQTNKFQHIPKTLGLYLERPDSVEHANAVKKLQEEREIIVIYQGAIAEKKTIGLNPNHTAEATPVQPRQSQMVQQAVADPIHPNSMADANPQKGVTHMDTLDVILKSIAHLVDSGHNDAAYWVMDKLLVDFPEHAQLHNHMAAMAYEKSDMQKAEWHYKHAVQLDPQNMLFLKDLGDFYYVVTKDADGALIQYEKVLELDPAHIETLMMAGHVSVTLHRYDQAQHFYQRVINIDPNLAEVRACLEKMKLLASDAKSQTMGVDDLYEAAQLKVQEGDREAGKALLEQLLGMDDNHAAAHNDLGVLNYEADNIPAALKHYEMAAGLVPENETFQKNLADFYFAVMGDHYKAMEAYVQVLKLEPRDVEALLGCSQVCLALGRESDARDFIETILTIEPWNEDARQLLEQLESIKCSSCSDETDVDLYDRAQLKASNEDWVGAIEDIVQLLTQSPDSAKLHNDLGVLYYENGQLDRALSCYERAVQLEPNDHTYSKNLADYYLIEQHRTEDALKLYHQVLEENPEDVDVLNALGLICVSLGKIEDADQFYRRVLEIEPWNQAAQSSLNNLCAGDVVANDSENPQSATAG